MQTTSNFRQAIQDYIFLLEKKYPEKTIFELVSTRYGLSHFERSMLYRGITVKETAGKRKKRIIAHPGTDQQVLHIDLFNVLFTIAAYLRGYPVYLSNDGLLRDASESHGSGDWEVHLDKGLDMVIEFLFSLKDGQAIIYLDNPLEYGLAISEKLRELAHIKKPAFRLVSDPSPDHLLREAKEGVILTSDSTIIDKSSLPVFDLPKFILEKSYNPQFLNIDDI